jgi:hypothetical protein
MSNETNFISLRYYAIELRGSRIRRSEDDVDSRLPGSKPGLVGRKERRDSRTHFRRLI